MLPLLLFIRGLPMLIVDSIAPLCERWSTTWLCFCLCLHTLIVPSTEPVMRSEPFILMDQISSLCARRMHSQVLLRQITAAVSCYNVTKYVIGNYDQLFVFQMRTMESSPPLNSLSSKTSKLITPTLSCGAASSSTSSCSICRCTAAQRQTDNEYRMPR